MFYKAIGFLVWKAVRYHASQKLPPRKLLVGGALVLGVATLVAAGTKRSED